MQALEAYPWPGNVRELQNIMERACALSDGSVITRRDLPDHLLAPGVALPPTEAAVPPEALAAGRDLPLKDARERWLQVLEASYLRGVLERHGGNISAAAKTAGIDRKTFHRLINKYQLS
jgi:two-component system, NtrC family, response regulator HydG